MRIRRQFWLAIIATFSAAALHAQTTGSASGRATDEHGGALPGVAIEAKGPALQGAQVASTDGSGNYRLPILPPGQYVISSSLSGFASEKRSVSVALGADTRADFILHPATSETVTVTGTAPVINTSSTTLGTNLDQHEIQTIPTDRNFASIAQVTPGVSFDVDPYGPKADSTTLSVYGSSSSENAYFIDGVDTSGVEYGKQGTALNYEFIQEVEVKTGGYEAEYGRSTGGIINVITKSGGNEFHGEAFGYYDSDSLQANNEHVGETAQGASLGFRRDDFGADLGGFILKDRLWFFGAYDRVTNTVKNVLTAGPESGQEFDSKSTRNLGSAKLTYRLGESGSLVASFFQDPRVDSGAISDSNHGLNGDPSTFLGRNDFGGQNYALRGDYLFAGSWLASLQGARHEERNSIGPASSDGDVIENIDDTASGQGFQTGGFGLIQKKNFVRDHFAGSLAKFLGNHEIKGGLEYEKETADVTKRMSGGQQVFKFDNPNTASSQPFIYQHSYWSVPNATKVPFFAPISQLNASPEHKVTTVYLQDNWNVLPNLTVNVGVRWDNQKIIDSSGVQEINLKKDYAPRFGFIWDPMKDSKTRVYGSFGRFYEEIPMDLVIRSYSFERQPQVINYSPTDITPDVAAGADFGTATNIKGGFIEPADPNLHGQYLREFVFGVERELVPDFAVGVKYIYRNYGEVIEDFFSSPSEGIYSVGNPGEGIMKFNFNQDAAQVDANGVPLNSTPYPVARAQRIFKGVEVDATKRFSKSWSMLASYLWSKLDGNYNGEFAPFTNIGPDPNISAAYDYADFAGCCALHGGDRGQITNNGPLSGDRRSQVKLSGTYTAPFGLNVGLSAYYRTGTPLSRYGFTDSYTRYEYFLTKRGSEGRTPSTYEADLHFGYPFGMGPVTINLFADVFNVLNAQRAILLDQRWDFAEADNSSPTPTNPNYGKPVLRQPPRSVRFGARVAF
jgi:hypothetical protein